MKISGLDVITVIPASILRTVFHRAQPFVYSATGSVLIDTDVRKVQGGVHCLVKYNKVKVKGDTDLAHLAHGQQ